MNDPRPAAGLSWLALTVAMTVASGAAMAQEPAATSPSPTSSVAPAAPPVVQGHGLAVLALAGATDAAWPLARAVYGSPSLRPPLDEAHARILAGEAPPEGSAQELKDLADTRAAVHGDDAPSRQLLASLGRNFKAKGILVVEMGADAKPEARVFLVDAAAFDAARYAPDAPAGSGTPAPVAWTAALQSLERTYGSPSAPAAASAAAAPVPTVVPGPSGALREGPSVEPPPRTGARKFYESPWFWGAIGAAAFAAGAVYFATRDNSPGSIHLQMQVPKQ